MHWMVLSLHSAKRLFWLPRTPPNLFPALRFVCAGGVMLPQDSEVASVASSLLNGP